MKKDHWIILIAILVVIIIFYAISAAQKTAEIKRQMELDRYNATPQMPGQGLQGWITAFGGLGTALGDIFGGGKDEDEEELTDAEKEYMQTVYDYSQTGLWTI